MKKAKHYLIALLSGVLVAATVLSGCGQSKKAVSKNDDHLTVYLWENRLMKNIVPYIHEQFPDQDIEFITGNNDTDLYSYFEEHGELPDIITVRRFSGKDAQLALVPYYYFTSSIYKGECTGSRVALMTAKSLDTFLYLAKINGKEIYELAEKYLAESDEKFHITNKYELPIASGMKIIVRQEENGFSLKDIEVNKKKIDKDKEYSILLTETTMSVLKKINPECEIRQLGNTTLSSAWTVAMANGQQPSAPEDYIEVEK